MRFLLIAMMATPFSNSIPEGARLRLSPPPQPRGLEHAATTGMMAEAAQRYGIIVRDYSPNIAFICQDPNSASST